MATDTKMGYTFVIIGKAGNGKSSTANSIVGKRVFDANVNNTPTASVPRLESSEFQGKQLQVIDGLDIVNCFKTSDCRPVEQCFTFTQSFSAFLIVIKFGQRFTEEERVVLEAARTIFGQDVFKKFGVCVFTHGDDFEHQMEDSDDEKYSAIEDWVAAQHQGIKDLYEECGHRVVLFNNRTKVEKQKVDQVERLLQQVKKLKFNYTHKDYIEASEGRSVLTAMKNQPEVEQKTRQRLEEIRQKLKVVKPDDVSTLQKFAKSLEELKKYITGNLGDKFQAGVNLNTEVDTLGMEIKSKINLAVKSRDKQEPLLGDWEMLETEKEFSTPKGSNKDVRSSELESKIKTVISEYCNGIISLTETTLSSLNALLSQIKRQGVDEQIIEDLKNKIKEIAEQAAPGRLLGKTVEVKSSGQSRVGSGQARFESSNQISARHENVKELESSNKKIRTAEEAGKLSASEVKSTPAVDDEKTIDLLLIGKTGNGKSATGNSILGRQAFKSTPSMSSVTTAIEKQTTTINGLTVNVVDGPGVNDTEKSKRENLEMVIDTVEQALELTSYSFTALLIVLKFGCRFTQQESDAIKVIKAIFGREVFKNYGICVLTHGDDFENEMMDAEDDEKMTFDSWCRKQGGDLAEVFKECDYGCVLFNNRTKDQDVRNTQVNKLMSLVRPGKRYSLEEFTNAEAERQSMLLETTLPELQDKTSKFLSGIREQMTQAEGRQKSDPDVYVASLQSLLDQLVKYNEALIDACGQSPTTESLTGQVKVLEIQISTKLRLHQQTIELNKPRSAPNQETLARTPINHNIRISGSFTDPLNATSPLVYPKVAHDGNNSYGAYSPGYQGAPSQVQYVAQSQRQYGAPSHGQYWAPSQGQHGAPSQVQYVVHSQGQYVAPSQGQYVAPSQVQYVAHSQGHYGAPSHGQLGAHTSIPAHCNQLFDNQWEFVNPDVTYDYHNLNRAGGSHGKGVLKKTFSTACKNFRKFFKFVFDTKS
ncbi:GTPase IMAP family member 8-like [Physella acuta]|uniref:GTPase IMAP family member 8-like n=1 Tax=Physella acuta TaxID=109671 RepID=UPI0027DD014E|nr:GTPase IMAP family member 8-like [Physella acuta]